MNMELDFIKEMFDNIAPKYDFLNRFLSLGQDILWRQEMVKASSIPHSGCMVLDVACGTCDVAIEVAKQSSGTKIIATDFSPGMLILGKKKVSSKNSKDKIHLAAGNALSLPFRDAIFDAVFIAFGIRNIMDRQGALQSFAKVLKKGGKVVVLELTSPSGRFLRDIYMFYFQRVLPSIGGLFSKNRHAYHYLPESVMKFPLPDQFAEIMRNSGFKNVKWKGMTFGIVTLFVGEIS
ncbi:bifunctional demethylmenaquinone methyltransferase/2-methoxy-6-polyprenyl-1,4-benzoquinol methylase UbiE [Desulfamplus magnetovallimortis]|nr:bifunctional demethylmenaquinone methyltransferase/2-methoxy-6-polyprenyl-1,4-benzoquinol methylase UbiE [Desulfamplus magnetovallimortis]